MPGRFDDHTRAPGPLPHPGAKDRTWIMQKEGHKDDDGKIRYDLIPAGPLHLLACLYTLGGVKYDDENWRKGISYKRLFGALQRHAWDWFRGRERDPETGLSDLVAVAWCAFSLIEFETQHRRADLDNRYVPPFPIDLKEFETALQLMIDKRNRERQESTHEQETIRQHPDLRGDAGREQSPVLPSG